MSSTFRPFLFVIAHTRRSLRIDSKSLPDVYTQVAASAEIGNLDYWLEIFFAAGIATFGLVLNSPAVIIGAMLISPLMGPIMAAGLTLAVGDLYLGVRALLNLVASVVVAIAFSALLVWLLPFHSPTAEIIARVNPNLLDLGTALLSGLAGSVVVCRGGGGGGITALPGVAIAVALMPPLCTVGFGLGSGANWAIMAGAGLLFLTNLVAIVSCAFAVFLLVGMGAINVEQEVAASRQKWSSLRFLPESFAEKLMAAGGQLRWRILMLVLLLATIAVPLRKALIQVATEATTRVAIQDALKNLISSDAIVSQQVQVSRDRIGVRLISTQHISRERITEAEQSIMRHTGLDANISVEEVASKTELADLMGRLAAPVPVVPKEKTFAEIQSEVMERVRPAVEEAWPPEAPLQDFGLSFTPTGIVLDVQYQADKDLGEIPLNMIQKSLQTRLNTPDLTLHVHRIAPPRATRSSAKHGTKTARH